MTKNNLEVELRTLKRDETLLYHQNIIEEIMSAIANETLQKKHFNMFRSVLEKSNKIEYQGQIGQRV